MMINSGGIVLGSEAFKRLPTHIKTAVLQAAGISFSQEEGNAPARTEESDAALEGLARLTERQVRKLIKPPINARSLDLLKAIASMPEHRYRVGDVLDALGGGVEYADLRGVLAGLTRRTRTVTNDPDIDLYGGVTEAEDIRDVIGEVHPETHASLRKAFGV